MSGVLPTPYGDAHLHLAGPARGATGRALLMHGAGTSSDVAVLLQLQDALATMKVRVARLDQPYRVAGRRSPPPSSQLDAVARSACAELAPAGAPLVFVGRSSGARVACRIARSVGAVGVVALGFPLVPPGRPEVSRADELAGAGVPVLVIQGERDGFGTPDDIRRLKVKGVTVHAVAGGDHSLKTRKLDGRTEADAVAEAVRVAAAWIAKKL
ncbi:MAG TPA: alpha/beta family hydrolase [Mycobacteriales bacterium]|nr:alpha/beta family hydrolase [Mycobacteriales bacterium]